MLSRRRCCERCTLAFLEGCTAGMWGVADIIEELAKSCGRSLGILRRLFTSGSLSQDMDPFAVDRATDFMSGIPPDIAVPVPQQIVSQQHSDARPGVDSTKYDFTFDFDFSNDVDLAFATAPYSFAPPVLPTETSLPDLIPAMGTRSTYSDASTPAPTTPVSSQTGSFHDQSSGPSIKVHDGVSNNPAPMAYSSWVGDPPASPNQMSIGVPFVDRFSTYGHLPWQQSASGSAADVHGFGRSSNGESFAFGHTLSLMQRSLDSPYWFHSLDPTSTHAYFVRAPTGMSMYGTISTPELASKTPAPPHASAFNPNQGTINPTLLHTSPPASRSLGSCFQDQEQPQPQHVYDAATAGALGQGIGMQVTPSAHFCDRYQHASPQATLLGHPAKTPVVPEGPARSGADSCGASQDPPKKGQQLKERKFKCPLCPAVFDRSYNLGTHLDGVAHFDKRPYTCDVNGCPKQQRGYTRQRELDGHYARKHPELSPRERKGSTTKGRSARGSDAHSTC
ncbi:hypothetical protein C8T65DRAFT_671634 [Cerioporus squamosus]|nr:hypothetical protein C8T65DRAFT_671634 [Cerioporus squamosus]